MKLPDGVFLKQNARAVGLFLLGALALPPVGCVSLDKPTVVEKCSASGTCTDDPITPGADAKNDVAQGNPDLVDEPVGGKEDLGPDGLSQPDASPDRGDAAGGKQDGGPDASQVEVATPVDAKLDRGSDSMIFADLATDPGLDLGRDVPDPGKDDVARDDLVKEDALKEDVIREDVTRLDVSGPEAARDVSPDSASNCSIFYGSGSSQGHPPLVGSKSAFCIATCDDIAGWGCSNFDTTRTVTVNGAVAKCGDPVAKKNGYIVFQISAGANTSAGIYWWVNGDSWATSCPAPAGGF